MRVVAAGDVNYFPGLCLTIASVLAFWRHPAAPRFFIMTTDIPERMLRSLQEMAARLHPGCELEVHMIGPGDLAALPPAPGLHRLAYARLLAPGLLSDERILYLDSDQLVLRDVSELLLMDLAGNTAAAPLAGRLGDDCPWLERDGLDPDTPYFCSGVMVVDCLRWKAEQVSERALAVLAEDPAACKCQDQTALNHALYGRVLVLSSAWSRAHWEFSRRLDEETFILHYITAGKPWRALSDVGAFGLWVEAFRIFCGKDFPLRAAKYSIRAKGRILEHAIALCLLAVLSTLRGVAGENAGFKRLLAHWKWRFAWTRPPAARPETAQCRRLAAILREAGAVGGRGL